MLSVVKFGLDIPFDGVLDTLFVSNSFSCFIDLKLYNTITMAKKVCHSIWFSTSFQKKLLLLTCNKGNKGFDF